MHDLVVREALKAMARDAAKRFRELVAAGRQIPYDVEEPGGASPLPQYIPLTERFIRDNANALLDVDSFGAGCAAIESADLAQPYLEEMGIAVPADGRERAELAGIAFLCRLWQGSTDFSLDDERLRGAVEELEAGGEVADDEIEVVVPVRGLRLPTSRLELATAMIVRADTVEVPAEARAPEGAGAAGWEPTFLAATRVSAGEIDRDTEPKANAGALAVEAFRQLITTLRLFKAGSVSLGPYAWTRAGVDRWRRIATGAGRSRPVAYRLREEELADLAAFSRTVAYRGWSGNGRGMPRSVARAISRFEAGLERRVVLEALNDYLLALRFLLEGSGPADLSLSIRVAALCAEPQDRGAIKAIIDRGLALERELWSGEAAIEADDVRTPAETTGAIEELLRAILRDAACGHLGTDLRSTADEILLADGLAVGEGGAEQRGGVEEWGTAEGTGVEPEPDQLDEEWASLDPGAPADADLPDPGESGDEPPSSPEREEAGAPHTELWIDAAADWEEAPPARRADEMQGPEPQARIKPESGPEPEEQNVYTNAPSHDEPPTVTMEAVERTQGRLEELLEDRPRERQRTADRVAYLFPRPEATEWSVRELGYDRRRRAPVRAT
jgi:hypothetical protein